MALLPPGDTWQSLETLLVVLPEVGVGLMGLSCPHCFIVLGPLLHGFVAK